jgi:murein DD-endopeptidase MepM/ murein hydrolase activator NlpD
VRSTRYNTLPVTLTNETIAPLADVSKAGVPVWRTTRVQPGDTLASIFNQMGISTQEMHSIIDGNSEAKSLQSLRPGQEFAFRLDSQGQLDQMKYQASVYESIIVRREADGFSTQHIVRNPEIQTAQAHAVIQNSLFVDGKEAGMSTQTVTQLANLFGWDIDLFQIQDGDSFSVIYEEKMLDGKKVEDGDILAASFTNNGKTYNAVRYTNKDGTTDYYSPEGLTMRKEFLRTPVDFVRISSYFSNARKHPVLNTIRAHKGVDYAAPQGTPIRAAGKGTIVFAGKKNGYGNVVEIKHNGTYSTLYAHMKGFAQGIKVGSSVNQGQTIGYVGMTGLATGPHLHYEFHVNGQYVNPLAAKLPMADPIAANEKSRFTAATQALVAQLKTYHSQKVALNSDNK